MAAEPKPDDALDPALVVGLLAEPARLRAVAALALGATTLASVAEAAGLDAPAALQALDRLAARGLVEQTAAGAYRLRAERLAATARAARKAAAPAPDDSVRPVVRNFLVDGRLTGIPVARRKRLEVLDWVAGRFEPGRVYPERDVNFLLGSVYADYAALRRYLVDDGFLERRDGFYWRAGGTFDVE
jgi:DNA-binding transcriptional ArsR family regulator